MNSKSLLKVIIFASVLFVGCNSLALENRPQDNVVMVYNANPKHETSCNGVMISPTLILTAKHCVDDSLGKPKRPIIRVKGRYIRGIVVFESIRKDVDLALIEIKKNEKNPPGLPICQEGPLVGDKVFLPVWDSNNFTIKPGVVFYVYYDTVHAAMRGIPGNSGGPLIYNNCIAGIFTEYQEKHQLQSYFDNHFLVLELLKAYSLVKKKGKQ